MPMPRPATLALTVLAYVAVTFGVQGTSHFVIDAQHYAAIGILRPQPVVPLGLLSMVIQGTIFAVLFPRFRSGPAVRDGVRFAWLVGGFLASYILFAESGKYAVGSIPSWVGVEASAAAVQYTLFGVLLGLIHRRAPSAAPTAASSRGLAAV